MARGQRRAGDGGTPATRALRAEQVQFTEHAYDHDPRAESYGVEAAHALGLDPAVVFKTLVVQTASPAQHGLAVAVLPVDRQLDLKALAAAIGTKRAAMAPIPLVEKSSGYVVGGVSPIGQKRALPTVVDDSARDLPTMYVSGGRRGYDLGLSPSDLLRVTGGTWASIAR